MSQVIGIIAAKRNIYSMEQLLRMHIHYTFLFQLIIKEAYEYVKTRQDEQSIRQDVYSCIIL